MEYSVDVFASVKEPRHTERLMANIPLYDSAKIRIEECFYECFKFVMVILGFLLLFLYPNEHTASWRPNRSGCPPLFLQDPCHCPVPLSFPLVATRPAMDPRSEPSTHGEPATQADPASCPLDRVHAAGPALTVDTACSSGAAAVHVAALTLNAGGCPAAIVPRVLPGRTKPLPCRKVLKGGKWFLECPIQ